jgi:hypothetical protein
MYARPYHKTLPFGVILNAGQQKLLPNQISPGGSAVFIIVIRRIAYHFGREFGVVWA